MRKLF
jgi:hypothetical protein